MLEVIDKGRRTAAHPVPLLFVHGGWHAAWCWDDHFLDFFAEHGFQAAAVSLRAHGKSATSQRLRACSIADYVADVKAAAALFGSGPVVVGHSMGGFVVQKFLESHHAPAGVLLASAPHHGTIRTSLRLIARHPWAGLLKPVTVGNTRDAVGTSRLVRDNLFSAQTPEQIVLDCSTRLQRESARAIGEMMFGNRPRPELISTPMLVLGAADDRAVRQDEVRATARAYGTEAQFFSDMGHDMMLEPGWQAVAEHVIRWLGHRGL
jgi:pimeloyl-ACP methyl ester carboxylesterase